MDEPLFQRTREEVLIVLQQGGERGAVQRAVRMQVTEALGRVEVTALAMEQIAYAVMCGAFQAAEHSGKPIAIVGEEASAGLLEAVREKGGQATQYLRDAIQGVTRAVEEYAAKLRDMASEVAERGRQALQGVIDRLKASSSS